MSTEGKTHFENFQETLAKYSLDRQEKLQWLWGYFHGELKGSKSRVAAELGVEWDQIRHAFGGDMSAKYEDDFFEAIDNLKRRASRSKPLVENIVAKRIIEGLNYCRDFSAMVYITGSTGRGKTYTSEWWAQENNHGRTKFLRAPSGCSRRALVRLMCQVTGAACRGNTIEMEENLKRALGPRNVVIIDEAGHLLNQSGHAAGAIEFLRDLHDDCKCGVALIFTDVYLKAIKSGVNADYFEQFLGRFQFQVEIPKTPRRDEVRAVVAAFVHKPSEEMVTYALNIARSRDGKLRTLFIDLYRADELAKSEDRPMTLSDLKAAVQWRQSAGAWPEDN